MALVGSLLFLSGEGGWVLYDAETLTPIERIALPEPPAPEVVWASVARFSRENRIFLLGTNPSQRTKEPGGTLIRFDPMSEEIRSFVNPVTGQAISSLAADERYVYCGTLYRTHRYGTGVSGYEGGGPAGGAVFFMWDPVAERIARRFVFPDLSEVAALGYDLEWRMVLVPVRNEIRRFSTETMSWLDSIRLPVDPDGPGITCRRFAFFRLGGAWYVAHENRVFAIGPGREPEAVLELPGRIIATATADGSTVYLAVAQHLYKVTLA